jgi:tetratricopeptide (TPR) repeat protein
MSLKLAILAVLMSATLATAQMGTAKQDPTTQGAQTPSPTKGTQTGSSQAQPSPANPSHLPQAKSKEEFDAYNTAAAETDPAKLEAAADAFAQKFPNSELKSLLYVRDMSLYQRANNAEKVIEVGRKAIALDPNNPVPLVNVASALAETTHDGDLDHDQRLAEAAKDANAAITNLDTGLQVPPNVPAERVAQVKASIQSMAYDTLGVVDMNKKDFAAAEQDLLKAVDASKNQPEAVVYLRLSVAQDNLKKYPQALESANKAVQYSPDGSAEQNLAKQQQARVQKLMSASGASATTGAAAPPTEQPPTAAAPAAQGSTPPPQPH